MIAQTRCIFFNRTLPRASMQIAYTRHAFKSVGINEDEYISTEYQYRESNHILFETEDY